MISDQDLQDMRIRCNAATPGPWYWRLPLHCWDVTQAQSRTLCSSGSQITVEKTGKKYDTPIFVPAASIHAKPGCEDYAKEYIEGISLEVHGKPQDEMFILKSRTDLPACLDEIDRLKAELKKESGH